MAKNKIVFGGNVLIDLTDLDVTAGDVVSGVTFIMNDGTKAVGTITIPTNISDLNDDVGLVTHDNSGNVSIAGTMTVEGHANYIGYLSSNSGSKSISTGTSYTALSGELTFSAGTWILLAQADFPTGSSSCVRALRWYNVTGSTAIDHSLTAQYGTTGFTGRVQSTAIVQHASSTKYRIDCFQSSGTSVTVSYSWRAIRIR